MQRYITDGMLGSMAKWLRLMGFDTLYFNTHNKEEMLRLARKEDRTVLTRDRKLFESNQDIAVFIEGEGTLNQLKEAKKKLSFNVNPALFFTRCSLCNVLLEKREKMDIKGLVPDYVFAHKDRFSQCPRCKRIYWEGDHCKEIREVFKTLADS